MLSFPTRLRILFAARPHLLTPGLRIVHRVIARFVLSQAGLKGATADAGSVTLIQRFGSAANLNIHLHCLVLDGVVRRTRGEPVFQEARAPTGRELQGLLEKIIVRLAKALTRLGDLVQGEGMSYLAELDPDNPLTPLQAVSCTYPFALWLRALFQGLNPHRERGVFAKQRTLGYDGLLLGIAIPSCTREKVV